MTVVDEMDNEVKNAVQDDVTRKAGSEAARKAVQRRNNWRLGLILFAVAAAFFASAIIEQLRAH
jgi:hypothetical protein